MLFVIMVVGSRCSQAGRAFEMVFSAVEFPSEGATLRGRLYVPAQRNGGCPAVIMSHGTSVTIGMVIDRYAEVFCAAGLVVLLYDQRGFGISGGDPRREINPWIQARGFRDALGFLQQVDAVDGSRIALWGDSFSAAEVLVVAAVDPRVTAVVAQIPFAGRGRHPPIRAGRYSP